MKRLKCHFNIQLFNFFSLRWLKPFGFIARTSFGFSFSIGQRKKKENTRPLLRALCLNKLSHVRNRQKLHVFFFPEALKKRAARALSGQN